MEFSYLVGLTLASIDGKVGDDVMVFKTVIGRTFKMLHHQDCCERVRIEEIVGDLADLIGEPILFAEERVGPEEATPPPGDYVESYTWTFYRIGTIKGTVVIRWLGESNGYYSETVDFEETTPKS